MNKLITPSANQVKLKMYEKIINKEPTTLSFSVFNVFSLAKGQAPYPGLTLAQNLLEPTL